MEENIFLERWLRILPGLYFHSTDEAKYKLMNERNGITGEEYLKDIFNLNIEDLEEIYSSDISELTMLKKLGIL